MIIKPVVTPIEHQLPTQAQIADRAHEIYLKHGARTGRELDDWLQAEYELMQLPVHKIARLKSRTSTKRTQYALVSLVQAAMILGATFPSAR